MNLHRISNDRPTAGFASRRWYFGEACLDEGSRALTVGGIPADIENRPLELLRVLLAHAGEVLGKQELIEAVWPGRVVVEAVLSNAVAKLRRALRDKDQTQVVTVHGIGYRLSSEVRVEWVERSGNAAVEWRLGDSFPARPQWRLTELLTDGDDSQTWSARHDRTEAVHIFRLTRSAEGLARLRCELKLNQLLRRKLGAHRGFAEILDWGFEQAPYFLEFAPAGVTLSRWCESRGGLPAIPSAQRIELAAELAEVLAAAHSAGVLHQSIGPDRVFVDESAAGTVRVCLSGFGGGLVPEASETPSAPSADAFLPANSTRDARGATLYRAPELALDGPPTTASDIYALGVLIFQICAGNLQQPMSGGWESLIHRDLLREDLALATHADAAQRLSGAVELARRLRHLPAREAARAQAREAAQRAQQTALYAERQRALRPWRRALILALVAGLVASAFFSWQADRARQLALAEAARSASVVEFLREDLLAAANPRISGRARLSLQEAVGAAAAMIDRRFAGEPETAAGINMTVAEVFHQLGDFEAAIAVWRSALSGLEAVAGPPAMAARAGFGLSESLTRASRLAEAAEALERARLALRRGLNPGSDAELALLAARASAALDFARSEEAAAETSLRAALAQHADGPTPLVEELRMMLGEVLARRGSHDEAHALLSTAVDRLSAELGPRHPRTLGARHALGRAMQLARREAELQTHYEALVADLRAVYGVDSEYVVLAEQGLANIYYKLQLWDRQLPLARHVLDQQDRRFGMPNLQTLGAAIAYTAGLLAQGQAAESVDLLQRYLPAARAAFGPQHLVVFVAELNYVAGLLGSGREAEAAALLGQLEQRVPDYCTHDPDCRGELALQRGRVLFWQGREAEARASLTLALELLGRHSPPDFWTLRLARGVLAQL